MLESKLLSTSTDQWVVAQVIVFDWYDGPRRGGCALSHPGVEFVFDLAEEVRNPNGLDLRTFRLCELPNGAVESCANRLVNLGPSPVIKPVRVPRWIFPDAGARDQAEQTIKSAAASARPTDLLISTPDMEHFVSCGKPGLQMAFSIPTPSAAGLPRQSTSNPE